ncbi:MAG: hypothetical protein H8E68_00125 [Kiritimatiellaeota bacterium]|nr:hypothetical protein [Kiritimatiellota bacterium]
MSSLNKGFAWCSRKVGLSEKMIFWSAVALAGMLFFSVVFTYPMSQKIRRQDAENSLTEVQLEELSLWQALDVQLNKILKATYAGIPASPLSAMEEERLLELPAQVEELAASNGVALVEINPRSVQDGDQISIQATFQGDMENLYVLLKEVGRVSYIGPMESISILALPDAEQMELKFKVPIQ